MSGSADVLSFTRYGKNHLVRKGAIDTLCHLPTRKKKAAKVGVRLCVKCRKVCDALSLKYERP